MLCLELRPVAIIEWSAGTILVSIRPDSTRYPHPHRYPRPPCRRHAIVAASSSSPSSHRHRRIVAVLAPLPRVLRLHSIAPSLESRTPPLRPNSPACMVAAALAVSSSKRRPRIAVVVAASSSSSSSPSHHAVAVRVCRRRRPVVVGRHRRRRSSSPPPAWPIATEPVVNRCRSFCRNSVMQAPSSSSSSPAAGTPAAGSPSSPQHHPSSNSAEPSSNSSGTNRSVPAAAAVAAQ